ncbi:MAG: hypothetical protein RIC95_03985 [Vicingaceae bacterium]
MRRCFLLLSLFAFLNGQAQLLLAEKEWFGLTNYFDAKEIQANKIEAIHIKVEDKKDGEIIRHKGNFLHYEFNKAGQLRQSLKSIPLARKIDTSSYHFAYDAAGRLYKKSEEYGPFHFTYFHFYQDDQLHKEVKIDQSRKQNDSLHIRFFKLEEGEQKRVVHTLNQKKEPFKTTTQEFNQLGLLKKEKTSFRRGRSYELKEYSYHNQKLSLLREERFFVSKKERLKKFFYTENSYREISLFEEGEIVKKRGFTYREDGLIKAVIERNYREKSIRIYHFMYRFLPLQKQ